MALQMPSAAVTPEDSLNREKNQFNAVIEKCIAMAHGLPPSPDPCSFQSQTKDSPTAHPRKHRASTSMITETNATVISNPVRSPPSRVPRIPSSSIEENITWEVEESLQRRKEQLGLGDDIVLQEVMEDEPRYRSAMKKAAEKNRKLYYSDLPSNSGTSTREVKPVNENRSAKQKEMNDLNNQERNLSTKARTPLKEVNLTWNTNIVLRSSKQHGKEIRAWNQQLTKEGEVLEKGPKLSEVKDAIWKALQVKRGSDVSIMHTTQEGEHLICFLDENDTVYLDISQVKGTRSVQKSVRRDTIKEITQTVSEQQSVKVNAVNKKIETEPDQQGLRTHAKAKKATNTEEQQASRTRVSKTKETEKEQHAVITHISNKEAEVATEQTRKLADKEKKTHTGKQQNIAPHINKEVDTQEQQRRQESTRKTKLLPQPASEVSENAVAKKEMRCTTTESSDLEMVSLPVPVADRHSRREPHQTSSPGSKPHDSPKATPTKRVTCSSVSGRVAKKKKSKKPHKSSHKSDDDEDITILTSPMPLPANYENNPNVINTISSTSYNSSKMVAQVMGQLPEKKAMGGPHTNLTDSSLSQSYVNSFRVRRQQKAMATAAAAEDRDGLGDTWALIRTPPPQQSSFLLTSRTGTSSQGSQLLRTNSFRHQVTTTTTSMGAIPTSKSSRMASDTAANNTFANNTTTTNTTVTKAAKPTRNFWMIDSDEEAESGVFTTGMLSQSITQNTNFSASQLSPDKSTQLPDYSTLGPERWMAAVKALQKNKKTSYLRLPGEL